MRAALAAPGTQAQTAAMAEAEAAGQTLVGWKPRLSTRSRPHASALGPDVAGGRRGVGVVVEAVALRLTAPRHRGLIETETRGQDQSPCIIQTGRTFPAQGLSPWALEQRWARGAAFSSRVRFLPGPSLPPAVSAALSRSVKEIWGRYERKRPFPAVAEHGGPWSPRAPLNAWLSTVGGVGLCSQRCRAFQGPP